MGGIIATISEYNIQKEKGMKSMKINYKSLIINIAIPLAIGGLSAWLTMGSMEHFSKLEQPPLSPPGWLFPVVWTILFVLMGIASYLVVMSGTSLEDKARALKYYGLQLIFNFFWSILFFNFDLYYFSFVWILLLLALIITTTVLFYKIDRRTIFLLLPYILWVAFASYLNLGIAILN